MIIDKLTEQKDFTNGEVLVAEFVLANLDSLSSFTASKLAKDSFTGTSTVVRLCQKVGAEGFQDFRQKVCLEASEYKRINKLIERIPIDENSTYDDIVDAIPKIYEYCIKKTRDAFNEFSLLKIVSKLRNANIVEIYGAGITSTIAQSAAFRLSSIGIPAYALNGVNEHNVIAHRKQKNKVAIVLSFTGLNSNMIQLARLLKNNGYYVVTMGGVESTEFKEIGDEFVLIYDKGLFIGMEVVTSITSANYIFDILFSMLLSLNYQKAVDDSLDVWRLRHEEEYNYIK